MGAEVTDMKYVYLAAIAVVLAIGFVCGLVVMAVLR